MLAIGLKRADESDEEAYGTIKNSKLNSTLVRHDDYWPFYHCDFKHGKVILTINTAHPFFKKVWEPLSDLAKVVDLASEDGMRRGGRSCLCCCGDQAVQVLVALQLMLHSLARTQGQRSPPGTMRGRCLENFRREWSSNLATQLNTP